MAKKLLQIQQLDSKIRLFSPLKQTTAPPTGWIKAIRLALGMSLEQLSKKLSITRQATHAIEQREEEGAVTIKTLKEVAEALDMQLVYAFVPNDGSLNGLIERKARELATNIVLRTSNTMKLEDQENSSERIEQAIEERTTEFINQMPKALWD